MMRLYTHPLSIVPWRVRIALHEKGLRYASVATDLYNKPPTEEFLQPEAVDEVLPVRGISIGD